MVSSLQTVTINHQSCIINRVILLYSRAVTISLSLSVSKRIIIIYSDNLFAYHKTGISIFQPAITRRDRVNKIRYAAFTCAYSNNNNSCPNIPNDVRAFPIDSSASKYKRVLTIFFFQFIFNIYDVYPRKIRASQTRIKKIKQLRFERKKNHRTSS